MSLSLKQVRYFIETANAGKISLAAANLGVSQSTITLSIKSLEGFLGRQLFERHPHGMKLTYVGGQFLQHANNIIATVDDAVQIPNMDAEAISGRLRVGITYTIAGYFLPSIAAAFCRTFRNVDLQIIELEREEIEAALISDDLDLGLMLVSNLSKAEQLKSHVLVRSRRRLWASPDHDLIAAPRLTLEEVSREPYLMLSADEGEKTALRYWARTPFRPNIKLRTSSLEAVRSLVATGMGVTVLSDLVYRPWSLDGRRIEVRELDDELPTMDLGFARCRDVEVRPPSRAFSDYLCSKFGSTVYQF